MPNKRSSKTQDVNQIAAEILQDAVGKPAPFTPVGRKNPAAVDPRRAGDAKRKAGRGKGLSSTKRKP